MSLWFMPRLKPTTPNRPSSRRSSTPSGNSGPACKFGLQRRQDRGAALSGTTLIRWKPIAWVHKHIVSEVDGSHLEARIDRLGPFFECWLDGLLGARFHVVSVMQGLSYRIRRSRACRTGLTGMMAG